MVCVKMAGWSCGGIRGDLRGNFVVSRVLGVKGAKEGQLGAMREYGGFCGF